MLVLVHVPLHEVGVDAAHGVQTLAEQYDVDPHAFPHVPQLFPSLRVSTHAVPHAVIGAVHRHTPAEHVCIGAHA